MKASSENEFINEKKDFQVRILKHIGYVFI